MRRFALLFMALLFLTLPAAAQTLPDEADESRAAPTLATARYHFEHSALPTLFYEQPESMLRAIKQRGIYALWDSFCRENHVESDYTVSDYLEHWYSSEDDTIILQIEMPKPEESPLCERVYLVYNGETDLAAYLTVEFDNFFGESNFLCAWTPEHEHVNYGSIAVIERDAQDVEEALLAEAEQVAEWTGVSPVLIPAGLSIPKPISIEDPQ